MSSPSRMHTHLQRALSGLEVQPADKDLQSREAGEIRALREQYGEAAAPRKPETKSLLLLRYSPASGGRRAAASIFRARLSRASLSQPADR